MAATVNCTASYSTGVPSGGAINNRNGGIEYNPSSAFTLNLTGSVISNDSIDGAVPTHFQPGNGITVGYQIVNTSVFGVPATSSVVPAPVTTDVNINTKSGSSIAAQQHGMAIWTDGKDNDIVIKADGNITAGSTGILAHTGNSGGADGAGSILIEHTGHIQTKGTAPGIIAWVQDGTNSVTIKNQGNGSIEGAGDGIVIGNPVYIAASNAGAGSGLAGPLVGTLLPSSGTGSVTNAKTIDVGGNGIIVNTTGDADVTNTVDGTIKAGGNGIQIGGSLLTASTPAGGKATVTNAGKITAGGHGITSFNTGGGTITNDEKGEIHATGNGINVGAVLVGVPTPSGGSFEVTNKGLIGTEDNAIGGVGIQVLASGNSKITNSNAIFAKSGGITTIVAGNAEVISPGDVTTTNGAGVLAVGGALFGAGTSKVNTTDGVVASKNGPGIVAAALGTGDVTVDAGKVNAGATGLTLPAPLNALTVPISGGVLGIANKGNAVVTAHDDITTGGMFGAAAVTVLGNSATLNFHGGSVNATNIKDATPEIGGIALVLSPSATGDAVIDVGDGKSKASVINGKQVGLLALNAGNGKAVVDMTQLGLDDDDPDTDLEQHVVNSGGIGIVAAALGDGDAIVDSGVVNAGAAGYSLPAPFDTVALSGGVIGIANKGNAKVNTHGDISVAAGGLVGAAAISMEGEADLNLNGITIDPPIIGGIGLVLGGTKDAKVTTGTANIDATGVGLLGLNFGTGNVKINAEGATIAPDPNVTPAPIAGIVGVTSQGLGGKGGGGSVDIDAATSTVNAQNVGVFGATFNGGNVSVDSGKTTVSNGVGVTGLALDGNVAVATHGDTTVGGKFGLYGVGAFASGTAEIDLKAKTVTNTTGLGVTADAGGQVDIKGEGSTVKAASVVGIMGLSAHENVNIDSGLVIVTNGSGVSGTSLAKNVDIDLHDDVTAGGTLGLFGVGGFAAGSVDIDLGAKTVTNTNGLGVTGDGGGQVDIKGEGSTVKAASVVGIMGLSAHENVNIDSGLVTVTNGSGVVGTSLAKNVDIDLHNDVTAGGKLGLFGVAGIAKINVDIDLGAKTVTNTTGIGVNADALLGDAKVTGKGSTVTSNATGILAAAGKDVSIEASNVTSKNGSGIYAISGRNTDVDVFGAVKGEGGILTPVVGGFSGGKYDLTITTGASVASNSGDTSDVAVGIASLDTISVVNDGTVNGTMLLASANGNYVQNNSNNTWNYSGVNVFTTAADNIVDNNGTANATNSASFFTSVGDSKLNNNATGTFNANGINAFVFINGGVSQFNNAGDFNVNGVSGFFGLDEYNNSGTTNMVDDAPFDLVFTSGDFNATGDSTLAIDAQLTPGGFADWLFIGGDLTGTTTLQVNDINGGPGLYTGNDDAILFALVGGDTDASNFTTNGGIDKGLFRYDAYLRETPIEPLNFLDWEEWVLASTLDREAFEFPVIQYGAQNLWYASTGTWLDRTADLRSAFSETTAAVDLKNEGAVASMPGNVTPGIWGRVFGGTSERDMENTSAAPEGLIGPENVFEDTFNQDYYGFMAGVDFGKEGVGANGQNTAWLFGIMGGYTGSNLDFDNSDTDVDYQQGSIGAYVTYLNGGFFADAAVKADFGNIDYSTNAGGGFSDDDSGDYRSIGVIVDTGYRYNGASGWFIEPKATLAYVNTDFDDLEVLGTGVEMSDGDSLRGRLGVRVGGTMVRDANLIEPYLEASLWNEFDGDYDSALVSNGFSVPVNYDAGGLSGEVAAGANIINVGNGWNAFAKGAVQFGEDDLLGFSGNLGFRKNW